MPLADAHRSGGWAWDTATKRSYANDLANAATLIAVDDGTNSSKSDKTPDQWLPPDGGYRCTYAIEWISVKVTWRLTVSTTERAALNTLLGSC